MVTFNDPRKLQNYCKLQKSKGAKIALVPTMGYLHEGHLSLIAMAKKRGATEIIVSVFVNPIQFCPGEDYERYPRDEKADYLACKKAGATAIFFPRPQDMYLPDHSIYIEETQLSKGLCGARRPGHFRGVCTVVAKLLNITQPQFAIFGQKDYQQCQIIKRMVRDLNFDTDVIMAPIVREHSGLAKSSRNTYLSKEEGIAALSISQGLSLLRRQVRKTPKMSPQAVKDGLSKGMTKAGLKVDYVECVDKDTLEPVSVVAAGTAVLIAAFAGKTRLIDNTILN